MFDNFLKTAFILTVICAPSVSCRGIHPAGHREFVATELGIRTDSSRRFDLRNSFDDAIPESVRIEDGLSQDDSVQIALWNNAAYRVLLNDLEISAARVYDAGLLSDPQFSIFFPIGTKQLEFTTFQAIDAIWFRHVRQQVAELDLEATAQSMVQNGLNTIRDARTRHANLVLAQRRAILLHEFHDIQSEIRDLAQKRLAAGDISELELASAKIEALQTKANAAAAIHDIRLAESDFEQVLGVPIRSLNEMVVTDSPIRVARKMDEDTLVEIAFAMRPDLRAVEIREQSITERISILRNNIFRMESVFDANEQGVDGFEAGGGLRMMIPIFNANKGKIAIAEEQRSKIISQSYALEDQIRNEVKVAMQRLERANEQLEIVENELLPSLVDAQKLAQSNYENGAVPYFLVLQTNAQYIQAKIRQIESQASAKIALAELERSVGRRLDDLPSKK